jgi:hypothetical protein
MKRDDPSGSEWEKLRKPDAVNDDLSEILSYVTAARG